MKRNKRLVAWFTSLVLTLSFVLPANVLSAYADETKESVNVETTENLSTEPTAEPAADENVKIQVLATTDLHGKFLNYDYATMSQAAGGLNQIATVVENEMASNLNTIVVDNGDTIQGNYNHLFLTDEFLKDNINPMVYAMNKIGYTSFSLGNHEFNYGMNTLNKIAEQAKAGGTAVLCANLYKDGTRVFEPYTIKTVDGVRVAIIGVVTNNITKWDADKLVGYTPTNPAEEVQKVMSEIKDKADVFIVTSHMGLTSEYGNGDSATDIANLNPEVDVIVAGHSHTTIQQEVVNGVLVTQPTNNGQGLSKTVLEIEKTADGAKVVNKTSSVIKLEKNSPVDEALTSELKKYDDIAKADANGVIGKLDGENLAEEDEVKGIPQSFVNDQGVTDLINEVQLYYSDQHLKSLGIDTSKIHHVSGAAMLSATSNLDSGDITKADLANIYKFDNKLYTIKTTGKQLKKYLEWTANLYNTFEEGDLTISFNPGFASYKYDMLSGVSYELNISRPVGERVENLKFNDGKAVTDADEIYLTVNDYRYSSNLAPMFDDGEHTKVYESTNDSLSDIRDMIARYITEVKGGTITRKVDGNWKLTGIKYDNKLRAEVVKLINDGTLTQEMSYGIVSKPLTWEQVSAQLTAAGETEKLAQLNALRTAKTVEFLSFNDFHGNVLESGKNIGAAKLAGVINSYKGMEDGSYGVIPVSAGDLYQGTAISNIKYGAPVTDMLKEIGLVASAIGNHEYDWGSNRISTWAKDGGFDFIAANVVKKGTHDLVDYAKPYKIVEKNGVKIAIIGIATPETAEKTLAENVKDVEFLDPAKTVASYIDKVKDEGANAIVVLAHSAAYQDSKTKVITGEAADIAMVEGVDAVISGHNHAFVSGTVDRNGKAIPIVQGGYNGRGLASVSFEFNEDNNLLVTEPSVKLLYENVKNLPVDEVVAAKIKDHNDELAPMMAEVITTTETELSHEGRNEGVTPLGVIVAETMRQIAGTQIGLTNGGGIRRTLAAGKITVGDMYEILPFDNTLVTVKVTGEELVKIIEHGINTKTFGWGQFAGIKVWYDAETGKVSSIRLNDGTKIDPKTEYSVVINDFMLTGGDGYDFSKATEAKDTFVVMRDAMAKNWKENGIPKVDYNVLVAGVDDTVDPEKPVKPEPPKPEEKPEKPNKPGKLPQTGAPIGADMVAMMGITAVAVGGFVYKRRKKNA
ncbi:5'-nucleotidase C-terminal domain-containing protein [Clostridium culturomicium]|uniref:5'-nucleotidase C-terminal domain-containing protein n=1 Tax=Clostridium culturomicium TaxID=1499683 RepID=UPI00058E3722|nr:5'-nucleotidase C-terminal domain-containing protein [Clostridium culturomicium]